MRGALSNAVGADYVIRASRTSPSKVAVAPSYQGSPVAQRDTAISGIDRGARPDNDFTRRTQANVISTPGTRYRQSAPMHYRTTAGNRDRSAYQSSSEDEKTVRPSESPLGTTATWFR
jgi:hypothetical protein